MAVGAHGQAGVPACVIEDHRDGPGSVMTLHHSMEGLNVQALMRNSRPVKKRIAFLLMAVGVHGQTGVPAV